ncbi:maleylpyruvate isomerase family mycothiol-dependent enzyme [Streptomyces sp. NPDC096311]|uniref:maleylpyruvate isomerase family mycothiol-dependent enzyme n=1 Tax=Streptomyces sp. NPDC096311 TaxID=3366083 RepID=UPI0038308198
MRTLETTLAWAVEGTDLCRKAVADLDEASYNAPSLLPGWTRKHVVAHVAANARALRNLMHWARTGEPTPMYNSPEQRLADIKSGAQLPAAWVTAWFEESAQLLAYAMSELTEEQWRAEVLTAQGRTVPASEVPWMRTREVMVHAVDLDTGIRFTDLPETFLTELRHDILGKRGLDTVPAVQGSAADITTYLAGRPYTGVTQRDGSPAEPLTPWL